MQISKLVTVLLVSLMVIGFASYVYPANAIANGTITVSVKYSDGQPVPSGWTIQLVAPNIAAPIIVQTKATDSYGYVTFSSLAYPSNYYARFLNPNGNYSATSIVYLTSSTPVYLTLTTQVEHVSSQYHVWVLGCYDVLGNVSWVDHTAGTSGYVTLPPTYADAEHGSLYFNSGDSVTFTATAAVNHEFNHFQFWGVMNGNTTTNPITTTIASDFSLQPIFDDLSSHEGESFMQIIPNTSGSLVWNDLTNSSNGFFMGPGYFWIPTGEVISVYANPTTGYAFASFDVTNSSGTQTVTANPYIFTLDQNTTVEASFSTALTYDGVVLYITPITDNGLIEISDGDTTPLELSPTPHLPYQITFYISETGNNNPSGTWVLKITEPKLTQYPLGAQSTLDGDDFTGGYAPLTNTLGLTATTDTYYQQLNLTITYADDDHVYTASWDLIWNAVGVTSTPIPNDGGLIDFGGGAQINAYIMLVIGGIFTFLGILIFMKASGVWIVGTILLVIGFIMMLAAFPSIYGLFSFGLECIICVVFLYQSSSQKKQAAK